MPFKFFYPWDDDEELCRARPGSPPAFFALPSPVSPRRCGNCMPGMAAATSAHPSKVLVPPLPQQQPRSSDQGSSDSTNENFAYDVYCFGKVLLQLVTGKLGLSALTDAETKEWLEQTLPYISIYDMELVTKIVDPLLIVDEDHLEQVWAMAIVARSCLNPKPAQRPPMRYVLKALENSLKIVREDDIGSGSHRSRGTWLLRELAAQLI